MLVAAVITTMFSMLTMSSAEETYTFNGEAYHRFSAVDGLYGPTGSDGTSDTPSVTSDGKAVQLTAGEYCTFSVPVTAVGFYNLVLQSACGSSGTIVNVLVNDVQVITNIPVPSSDNLSSYTSYTSPAAVNLSDTAADSVKIVVASGTMNLEYLYAAVNTVADSTVGKLDTSSAFKIPDPSKTSYNDNFAQSGLAVTDIAEIASSSPTKDWQVQCGNSSKNIDDCLLLANNAIKLKTSFLAVTTSAAYQSPVQYELAFKAHKSLSAAIAGITLRQPVKNGLYGDLLSGATDKGQGIYLTVYDHADTSNISISFNTSDVPMSQSPRFAIPHPSGFINSTSTDYNLFDIYDNGDTIGISINHVPYCIIAFTGLSGDHYTGGAIYTASGNLLYSFAKNVLVASRLGIAARTLNSSDVAIKSVVITQTSYDVGDAFTFASGVKNIYTSDFSNHANFSEICDTNCGVSKMWFQNADNLNSVGLYQDGSDKVIKALGSDVAVSTHQTFTTPVHYSFDLDGESTYDHAGFMLRQPLNNQLYGDFNAGSADLGQGIAVSVSNNGNNNAIHISVNNADTPMSSSPRFEIPVPASGYNAGGYNHYDVYDNGSSIGILINGSPYVAILLYGLSDGYYTSGVICDNNSVLKGKFSAKVQADSRFGVETRSGILMLKNVMIESVSGEASSLSSEPPAGVSSQASVGSSEGSGASSEAADNPSQTTSVSSMPSEASAGRTSSIASTSSGGSPSSSVRNNSGLISYPSGAASAATFSSGSPDVDTGGGSGSFLLVLLAAASCASCLAVIAKNKNK